MAAYYNHLPFVQSRCDELQGMLKEVSIVFVVSRPFVHCYDEGIFSLVPYHVSREGLGG